MSQETFNAHEAAIRAGVEAIMRNPERRRTSRIFELHEERTGELLAEVFRTTFGPVIAHRSWGDPDSLGVIVVGAPRGRGKGKLVIAPLTDDAGQRFPIMARNYQYRFPVQRFRQWIAANKKQHAVRGVA